MINTPVRARSDIASAFSKWCEMVIRNSGKRLRRVYLPFIGNIQIGLFELFRSRRCSEHAALFLHLAYPDQEIGDPRGVIVPSDEVAIEAVRVGRDVRFAETTAWSSTRARTHT